MDPMGSALGILLGLLMGSIFILVVLSVLTGAVDRIRTCRPFWPFHVWSKWSAPYNGTQTRQAGNFGETRSYPVVIQSRCCKRCGSVDYRIEDVDAKIKEIEEALHR